MKAIYKNIVNEKRHVLQDVIPLATPYMLAVDPCNLCNFRCKFCAMQFTRERQNYIKQMMSYTLFCKIINDIKEFPDKLKVLRINGQGEPLLNPDFCKMVRYAKEAKVADWIETITNGSCLNAKLNQNLADSGINRIRISIEAISQKRYEDIANTNINFDKFIDNIRDLYERCRGKAEIYIKTVDIAVPTEKDKNKFFKIFGDICDRIFIDHIIPLWSDFNELNDYFELQKNVGTHGQTVKQVIICPFPFYSLVINADGDVTACCADWKRKLIFGNLTTTSLKQVWNSDLLHKFWIDLASKKKNDYEMCKKCLLPTFDCNDNIDDYGTKILKHLVFREDTYVHNR